MESFSVENLHYELKDNCLTIYKNQKGKITFFLDSYLEDELKKRKTHIFFSLYYFL